MEEAKKMDAVLVAAGWEDYGGGNSFTAFTKGKRNIYVFGGSPGSGPEDSHWVEVDNKENILKGGFTAESLVLALTGK